MKSKKYIRLITSLLLVLLTLTAMLNIVVDPLFLYHKPLLDMQPVITDERYQNAGIAKTFDFENVIIGNSMSENFRASSVSRVFGGDTVKLVASGSHPLDWTYILHILAKRKTQPKNILINIDSYIFSASTTEMKHELPLYLYDDNPFNDVKYLFNFSIIKKYTLETIKKNLSGTVPNYDEAFMWNENIGKKYVLENYKRAEISQEKVDSEKAVSLALENIELITKYIEIMPDTEFIFFFSPFSILSYDEMIRTGKLSSFEMSCKAVCEELLTFENIRIYFGNDKEVKETICNLDLYRDSGHYCKEVNENILVDIENNIGFLDKNNYEDVITKFFDFVRSYDYESIFM